MWATFKTDSLIISVAVQRAAIRDATVNNSSFTNDPSRCDAPRDPLPGDGCHYPGMDALVPEPLHAEPADPQHPPSPT